MYGIMGATGQTGSAVAKALLVQALPVRVIVRKPQSSAEWQARGADAALADAQDLQALTRAFTGGEGVYLMNRHDARQARAGRPPCRRSPSAGCAR